MIVNYKKPKAGIKVIPVQDDKFKVIDHIVLLPGHNEVPDKLWAMARKNVEHDENVVEVTELTEAAETESKKTFNDFIKALEDLKLLDDAKKICKAETEKSHITKEWLSQYFEDNPEIADKVNACLGAVANKEELSSLRSLQAQRALEVVLDTYSLDTLNIWRKVEHRDEIRAAIANQIESVEMHGVKNKEKKLTK